MHKAFTSIKRTARGFTVLFQNSKAQATFSKANKTTDINKINQKPELTAHTFSKYILLNKIKVKKE